MSPSMRYNSTLIFKQFCKFLNDEFGSSLSAAREDPHVLRFIDHCVERPTIYAYRHIQRPIRRFLVWRIRLLAGVLAEMNASLSLSRISFDYAREMSRKYASVDRGSIAATPSDIVALVERLNERDPHELRLKACVLLLWATWARPSELLRRYYPHDICAKYRRGIVIAIPRSKTNVGPSAEYIAVEHDPNKRYCAVCALRRWLDWLGEDYDGPLFPVVMGTRRPGTTPQTTLGLREQLKITQRRHGLATRITPYSFRKGAATAAAANSWKLEDIQRRLRHRSFNYSVPYIDRRVLMQLMKQTLD